MLSQDVVDKTNLQRAAYRLIADPENDEKARRAIRNMRANPPITAQTLREFSENDQKKLSAAIDAFWARGNKL